MEVETPDRYSIRLSDGQEFGPATLDQILQWGREGRVPIDSLLLPEDGSPVRSVLTEPQLQAIIQAPPTVSSGPPPTAGGGDSGGIATMIPYRNPAALTAYYLGLFSLLPLVGLLLAVPALIFGIIGLRNRLRNPAIKGSVHAWIGIIMGGVFTLVWGFSILVMIIAAASNW